MGILFFFPSGLCLFFCRNESTYILPFYSSSTSSFISSFGASYCFVFLPTVYAFPVNLLVHFLHSYIPYAILFAFGFEQYGHVWAFFCSFSMAASLCFVVAPYLVPKRFTGPKPFSFAMSSIEKEAI